MKKVRRGSLREGAMELCPGEYRRRQGGAQHQNNALDRQG